MNRRDALRLLAAVLAGGGAGLVWAGPRVLAVRAWPGKESTRVTIESDAELRFFVSSLANPDRTVVDISDVQADATFKRRWRHCATTPVCCRARALASTGPTPHGWCWS